MGEQGGKADGGVGPGAKVRWQPHRPGIPLQRGQQLPCSVTWSGQGRRGHCSRTQLTWPACKRCRLSDLHQTPHQPPLTAPYHT